MGVRRDDAFLIHWQIVEWQTIVIARSEATKQSRLPFRLWIASLRSQ
jgi:hypothetical protein